MEKTTATQEIISFYIECFNRYLNVEVFRSEKEKAAHTIKAAYNKWVQGEDGSEQECCEEYICKCLKETGIPYREVNNDISEDCKLTYLEELAIEMQCNIDGIAYDSGPEEEQRFKLLALKWAIKICNKEIEKKEL